MRSAVKLNGKRSICQFLARFDDGGPEEPFDLVWFPLESTSVAEPEDAEGFTFPTDRVLGACCVFVPLFRFVRPPLPPLFAFAVLEPCPLLDAFVAAPVLLDFAPI